METDFGVHIVDLLMKMWTQQQKGNSLLGDIRNGIKNKADNIVTHSSMMKPYLEYCMQFWLLYLKNDIEELEKAQSRETNLIKVLKYLFNKEKLNILGLFSLAKTTTKEGHDGAGRKDRDNFSLRRTQDQPMKLMCNRLRTN